MTTRPDYRDLQVAHDQTPLYRHTCSRVPGQRRLHPVDAQALGSVRADEKKVTNG